MGLVTASEGTRSTEHLGRLLALRLLMRLAIKNLDLQRAAGRVCIVGHGRVAAWPYKKEHSVSRLWRLSRASQAIPERPRGLFRNAVVFPQYL